MTPFSLSLSPPPSPLICGFEGLFVAQLFQSLMLHQYFNTVFHVAMQAS